MNNKDYIVIGDCKTKPYAEKEYTNSEFAPAESVREKFFGDKEKIIVNGVDVSGCEYYVNHNCGRYHCDCNAIDGCLYKQLQAKTQECEELKKELEQTQQDFLEVHKQTCDELKESNRTLELHRSINKGSKELWITKNNTVYVYELKGKLNEQKGAEDE